MEVTKQDLLLLGCGAALSNVSISVTMETHSTRKQTNQVPLPLRSSDPLEEGGQPCQASTTAEGVRQ